MKRGPEFRFASPRPGPNRQSCPAPPPPTGRSVTQAWDRVHPRHRAAWLDHEGELPLIEDTLIRLEVEPTMRMPEPAMIGSGPSWSSHAARRVSRGCSRSHARAIALPWSRVSVVVTACSVPQVAGSPKTNPPPCFGGRPPSGWAGLNSLREGAGRRITRSERSRPRISTGRPSSTWAMHGASYPASRTPRTSGSPGSMAATTAGRPSTTGTAALAAISCARSRSSSSTGSGLRCRSPAALDATTADIHSPWR